MMKVQNQQVELYREIMGSYPTGVTILTTTDDNNNPVGITVNSFASVSMDPLMVLWCIDKRSSRYEAFEKSGKFAVNILAGDQKKESTLFARSNEKDRFSKTAWEYSPNKLPILDGVFGVLECQKVEQVDAGDHLILIGEAINLNKNDKDPMLYYRRNVGFVPDRWSES